MLDRYHRYDWPTFKRYAWPGITDIYTLHPTLEAIGCVEALNQAIHSRKADSPYFLIHHSDRGVQYCCSDYIDLLNQEGILISMTQSGSPYDNALAERVNGIIKNEFYPKKIYQNHKEAVKAISKIVDLYNQKRPHCSIDYLTPAIAHEMNGPLKKRWKTYPRLRKPLSELAEVAE